MVSDRRVEEVDIDKFMAQVPGLTELTMEANHRARDIWGHRLTWRPAEYFGQAMFGECAHCPATVLVLGNMGQAFRTKAPLNGRALIDRCPRRRGRPREAGVYKGVDN